MANPTPTDWRALCAQLFQAVQLYTGQNPYAAETPPNELVFRLMDAMAATSAALAQPEPQGPTDEELDELWSNVINLKIRSNEIGPRFPFARAVLQCWGRHAIEPVPQESQ